MLPPSSLPLFFTYPSSLPLPSPPPLSDWPPGHRKGTHFGRGGGGIAAVCSLLQKDLTPPVCVSPTECESLPNPIPPSPAKRHRWELGEEGRDS